MKLYHYLLIVLLFQYNISAQNTGESKLGSWYDIYVSNRISDKLSLKSCFTSWNYELSTEKSQFLLGIVGINYHFNKNVIAGIGYAYGNIEPFYETNDIPNVLENRILEDLILKHKSHQISWSHRFRLEQRFLQNPTKNILKHRVRYRFKGSLPINKTLVLFLYDEIHFNLNKFDFQQNRVHVGLGVKFNKNTDVEFGYVRHSFKTQSFNRLALQLNLKFDFRKEDL